MADILYPEQIPVGGVTATGPTPAPAAPTPASDPSSNPVVQPPAKGGHGGSGGEDSGGKGGFLGSPIAKILVPVGASILGAVTGGLAFPALGLGAAGLGEVIGGGLGGALGGGLEDRSLKGALLGGLGGAAGGGLADPLVGGLSGLTGLGVQGVGGAVPGIAAASGSAAGAAAPGVVGAGEAASAIPGAGIAAGSAGQAADPLAAALNLPGGAGTAGGPAFFGAAENPAAAALPAAAAAGGTGAAPAAGGTALEALLQGNLGQAGSDVLSFLGKNPMTLLQLAPTVAGLMGGVGQGEIPGMSALEKEAKQLKSFTGSTLDAINGNLPPGAQALVHRSLADSEAAIKANYASLGLSGSSMEAQDLAAAQERNAALTFQIGSQITQQGLEAAGLEGSLYAQIAQAQIAQDQQLAEALGGFSSAIGFGGGLQRYQLAA